MNGREKVIKYFNECTIQDFINLELCPNNLKLNSLRNGIPKCKFYCYSCWKQALEKEYE